MLALVADRSSSSGVSLREAPEPRPGPSEALVEVRAVSLNRGEVRRLPARAEGTIPGWDVAGVVRRTGESGPRERARVVGLATEGGWAELAAVPTSRLAELPDGVSFEAASTLPVAGLTAIRALEVGAPASPPRSRAPPRRARSSPSVRPRRSRPRSTSRASTTAAAPGSTACACSTSWSSTAPACAT